MDRAGELRPMGGMEVDGGRVAGEAGFEEGAVPWRAVT